MPSNAPIDMPLHLPTNLLFRAFLETQVSDHTKERDIYFEIHEEEGPLSLQEFLDGLLVNLVAHENPIAALHATRQTLQDVRHQLGCAISAYERYVSFGRLAMELASHQKARVRIPAATC